MSLVVEDGTGKDDSNSYAALSDCVSYCNERGLTFPASPASAGEAALIRATASIDAMYRSRFSGQRLKGRAQALEWPRKCATDSEGNEIAQDEVPDEIFNATCEAAVRELAEPGSLMPDLERGGAIKSLSAGSVSIEYQSSATATTTFSIIDGLLSGLLGGGARGNNYVASAVRG